MISLSPPERTVLHRLIRTMEWGKGQAPLYTYSDDTLWDLAKWFIEHRFKPNFAKGLEEWRCWCTSMAFKEPVDEEYMESILKVRETLGI